MANDNRKQLEKYILEVTSCIAGIIRSTPKISAVIHNSTWSVADAGAHLVITQKLFTQVLLGVKSPYGDGNIDIFAEVNEKYLKEFKVRGGKKLASLLIKNTEIFLKETTKFVNSDLIQTHFGPMNVTDIMRYSLCHLLIHGSDISLALNVPLPVKSHHVNQIVLFFKKMMSRSASPESNLTAKFYLQIKEGPGFAIICNNGSITVSDEIPRNVDCRIDSDPIDFFLISMGIISPWKSILKRKTVLSGRRPWVAFQLKNLFPNP